ncbi:MAG: hypothetical protein ACRDRL_14190 [Sciscionella sp.]
MDNGMDEIGEHTRFWPTEYCPSEYCPSEDEAHELYPTERGDPLIDCDSCQVRGSACAVGVPHDSHREVFLDAEQHRAIGVLAEAGMIPRLRLLAGTDPAMDGDTPLRVRRGERAFGHGGRLSRRVS